MARLLTVGFEGGSAAADGFTTTGTGGAYDTSVVYAGTKSRKWTSVLNTATYDEFLLPGTPAGNINKWYWAGVAFYLPIGTVIPSDSTIISFNTVSGNTIRCKIRPDRTIAAYDIGNVAQGAASAAVSLGSWHKLSLGGYIGSGSNDDQYELYVDGTFVSAPTGLNTTNNLGGDRVRVGWPGGPSAANIICYFDELIVNDDTGASNNTRPSSSLVTPNSTSQYGVGTYGTATYTSGDSTPPIVTITSGPTATTISRVVGFDSSDVQFTVNEAIQAWQVRVVPSGASVVTAGTLLESGGAAASGATVSVNITDDELLAATGAEGTNTIKVFARDIAGNWSTA